jgi:hypothetical protein
MRRILIPGLATATATAAAALLIAWTATPALADSIYTGYGVAFGATSSAAESAAIVNLNDNNSDCFPASIKLVFDIEQSNGTWYAEVSARCVTGTS